MLDTAERWRRGARASQADIPDLRQGKVGCPAPGLWVHKQLSLELSGWLHASRPSVGEVVT